MKLHRLLALAFAWAAFTSCAQTPPAAAPEPESKRLAQELRTLIGPAACTEHAQCRTVPIGAKACGGPSGYLAWSSEGTDAEAVEALAKRQSEAQRREVEASGMRSNCAVVSNPGAQCVAKRCQLQTATSAR